MRHFQRASLALACFLAACGGDEEPADVAGSYTLTVVGDENGCDIQPWSTSPASDIEVTVVQVGTDRRDAVLTVEDTIASLAITALLGDNEFAGEVDGDDLSLERTGSTSQSRGNCAFTYDAELEATLDGDSLSGEIRYRAVTNDNPDCQPIKGCVSVQKFNGTRPPR